MRALGAVFVTSGMSLEETELFGPRAHHTGVMATLGKL